MFWKSRELMMEELGRSDAADVVLLDALSAGLTHMEAAVLAGVSTKTVQRRLQEASFAAEVTRRRAVKVQEITAQLTTMGTTAIGVLAESMTAAKPELRLRAAEATLAWLTRFRREVDFELRLSNLETVQPAASSTGTGL